MPGISTALDLAPMRAPRALRYRRVVIAGAMAGALAATALGALPAQAATGSWAKPIFVSRDGGAAFGPKVAGSANGSFAVATWEHYDFAASRGTRMVSVYLKHLWSQPHGLTADGHRCLYDGSVAISADGKRAVVAWIDYDMTALTYTPEIATWNGTNWSSPVALNSPTTESMGGINMALSSDLKTGLATWVQGDSSVSVQGVPLDAGAWGDSVTLSNVGTDAYNATPAVSLDGKVRMIQFVQNLGVGQGAVLEFVRYVGGQWTAAANVGGSSQVTDNPSLVLSADGKTAISTWIQNPSSVYTAYAAVYKNGAWIARSISEDAVLPQNPVATISGDGKRGAVGFSNIHDGVSDLRVREWSGANWLGLETITTSNYVSVLESLAVSRDGKQLTAATRVADQNSIFNLAVKSKKGSLWTTPVDPAPAASKETGSIVTFSGDGAVTFMMWLNYTDPNGQALWATTRTAAPTLTTVTPTSGKIKGGNKIVVKGTALTGATVVIGGRRAKVLSGTSAALTILVPAHKVGKVSITVATVGGSITKANAYTYKK